MDAGVIIAIVVGALVLAAAIFLATKMARERRPEGKREEARALADEQAAEAEKHRRFARERHEEAQDLDPDAHREEEHARRERS